SLLSISYHSEGISPLTKRILRRELCVKMKYNTIKSKTADKSAIANLAVTKVSPNPRVIMGADIRKAPNNDNLEMNQLCPLEYSIT
ncbi:hypothetical protein KAR04_00050, partial [Candidatus Calescamantes bacterium]|nr:hypothetical protein [Candidatus Calescamantes bacterium]